MKRIIVVLFFSLFLISFQSAAQTSKPLAKTLLWRISGNGLTKNSYLYGSMHLQDKRLFYFSDSLYRYMEQADGYAMEVDLREFIDSFMQKMMMDKDDKWLDKKRLNNPSQRKKIIDSLIANVKLRNDKYSKKKLEDLRDERVRKAIKNREMPTMMDAYLYGLARRQGKWLGGIEDIQDQMEIYDELGNKTKFEELFAPDEKIRESLERMINIYLSADLEKIDFFVKKESAAQDNFNLIKRNTKMAMRMDSLSHVRSVFFTVGAAHLPGDSGVINLLRKKGYQLDPVFSTTKVDPIQYAAMLPESPWVKVEDEEKNYLVQMPEKATDISMGELKMKFCVDFTTLTYFITATMYVEDVDMEAMVKRMGQNKDAKVISERKVEINGNKGIEKIVFEDDQYFKAQYFSKDSRVYMIMAASEKEEDIRSSSVSNFFKSLVINKRQPKPFSEKWESFAVENKGVIAAFPGKPKRNLDLEHKADGSQWNFTVYDYIDASSDTYFMLQIRDIISGFYLSADTNFFSLFRENMKSVIKKVTVDELTEFESFPAYRLDGKAGSEGLIYKTFTINRGSRVYTLFTGGSDKPAAVAGMNHFINSLVFTPYKGSDWKREYGPGGNFYSMAPSAFELSNADKQKDSTEADKLPGYITYDSVGCITYYVFRTKMDPYYWANNDSVFYHSMGLAYKAWNDSLISKKVTYNGGLKGMEWVFKLADHNNNRKVRQFLNGDTLVTIMGFIPPQIIDQNYNRQFFEEFRITKENPQSNVFKSKAALLLKDLQSTDSATFAVAFEQMRNAPFTEEDRPLLQEALLKEYMDDFSTDYNCKDRISDALTELTNDSTVAFIKNNYRLQTGKKEQNKMLLLNILAGYKTSYSYSVLKELLLQHTPKDRGNYQLSYFITDSLELAKILFPEALSLSTNELFAPRITAISYHLLADSIISKQMLLPYEKNFIHTADTMFARIANETFTGRAIDYLDMLKLMGMLNDTASNRILKKYLILEDLYVKQTAALALLKNKHQVDPKQIEKIAADMSYRRDFYDALVKINSQRFFPIKYNTQQYMAESDLYLYASDDEEPKEIKFLKVKTAMYNGVKKNFYLYKVSYISGEDDEKKKYEYLGIAGPFAADTKNIASDLGATGLFDEEFFDAKKIDKHFEAFLKNILENQE